MLSRPNTASSSEYLLSKGEVLRTAMVLVKCKGPDALEYSNRKAEVMEKNGGEEEDIIFWKKISKQIEMILYSDD